MWFLSQAILVRNANSTFFLSLVAFSLDVPAFVILPNVNTHEAS
jgi:hypothetical protein